MKQICKPVFFMFSILALPFICFAGEQHNDRTYLSSVLGILEIAEPDSSRTLQTSEDASLKELAKQTNFFASEQSAKIETLLANTGGKDPDIIAAMKPAQKAFSMNMDMERTYAKDMLAYYNRIIELSEQAQTFSENQEVKTFASKLIEAATPVRDGFITWIDNWKPAFKGGFG